MFIAKKGLKMCEEDNYEKGCLPDTGFMMEVDVSFEAHTEDELLKKISQFYGVKVEDMELNACGEIGRVDISLMEDRDSYKPSEDQIEKWKRGEIKLYYSIYTHRIYECSEVTL